MRTLPLDDGREEEKIQVQRQIQEERKWGVNEHMECDEGLMRGWQDPGEKEGQLDSAVHGQTGEGIQGKDDGVILPLLKRRMETLLQRQLLAQGCLWPLLSFDPV